MGREWTPRPPLRGWEAPTPVLGSIGTLGVTAPCLSPPPRRRAGAGHGLLQHLLGSWPPDWQRGWEDARLGALGLHHPQNACGRAVSLPAFRPGVPPTLELPVSRWLCLQMGSEGGLTLLPPFSFAPNIGVGCELK